MKELKVSQKKKNKIAMRNLIKLPHKGLLAKNLKIKIRQKKKTQQIKLFQDKNLPNQLEMISIRKSMKF